MGTSCAPQLANIMLHQLEFTYIKKPLKTNNRKLINRLEYTIALLMISVTSTVTVS